MSYFPDSVLKKLNNVLKPDSIKRYSYWLKDVSPEYSQSKLATFYKDLPNDFKRKPDATSILSAIIKLLKVEGYNDNDKPIKEYQKLINEIRGSNIDIVSKPKDKDIENKITVDDILKLRKQKEEQFKTNKDLKTALQLQVLYLYTEIPALRSQDYINTSFNSKNSTNYINLNKKELIIKEGKTTNKTNTRIIDIPDIVITIIKKVKSISNSIWLIPKLKNTNEHIDYSKNP
jgi:integrase